MNYRRLVVLLLSRNPLRVIGEDTFFNNFQVTALSFIGCQLESFPKSFGLAINSIKFFNLWSGIRDPRILQGPYFRDSTALQSLVVANTKLFSLENLTLPQTIWKLNIGHTRLTYFPNITAARLPRLRHLEIFVSNIGQIPTVSYDAISNDLELNATRGFVQAQTSRYQATREQLGDNPRPL